MAFPYGSRILRFGQPPRGDRSRILAHPKESSCDALFESGAERGAALRHHGRFQGGRSRYWIARGNMYAERFEQRGVPTGMRVLQTSDQRPGIREPHDYAARRAHRETVTFRSTAALLHQEHRASLRASVGAEREAEVRTFKIPIQKAFDCHLADNGRGKCLPLGNALRTNARCRGLRELSLGPLKKHGRTEPRGTNGSQNFLVEGQRTDSVAKILGLYLGTSHDTDADCCSLH